jgi:hypothetical protein
MEPENRVDEKSAAFYFGGAGDPVVEQFRALVELARWALALALGFYSCFIPFFGIIFGLILMKFAVVPKNQGLGKICLILGFVPLVFLLLYCLLWILVLGGMSALH